MPLSEQEIRRLNLSMPVANDVGLGDILKALESATGGEITVTWNDVSGKPATFPPATHTHTIDQVTNLQTELGDIKARLTTLEGGGGA